MDQIHSYDFKMSETEGCIQKHIMHILVSAYAFIYAAGTLLNAVLIEKPHLSLCVWK